MAACCWTNYQRLSVIYDWPDFKPEEKPLYRLDPSVYQQYVGRYEVNGSYYLDISFEDYYLVVHPTGQTPTKFYVETQTYFFLSRSLSPHQI